ncbi:MAG: hypothetical protein SWZ49_28725, partial [Cyanobacteriota bacterium]|nr:hypothetical protein [Cyanobacteriota bacterium]
DSSSPLKWTEIEPIKSAEKGLAITLILVSISPVIFRRLLLLDWDFQSQVGMGENRLDLTKQTSSSSNH